MLHIGDWNGDGRADVIGVDKKTGAMTVWLTSWNNGVFTFAKQTSSNHYCTQGWGVGRYDLGVQFADITGGGCVDYLCLEPNRRVTAWLNECKKSGLFDLRYVGQVKRAEPLGIGNIDRANIRYADINGRPALASL
jgi:FG-GAP-like repeat